MKEREEEEETKKEVGWGLFEIRTKKEKKKHEKKNWGLKSQI